MSAYTAAEEIYIAANAAAEERYNAGRSRAYAAYAATLDGADYAGADAAGRRQMHRTAYAVLADSVEDAEIARDTALDANYSIYLAAVAESTP